MDLTQKQMQELKAKQPKIMAGFHARLAKAYRQVGDEKNAALAQASAEKCGKA